MKTEKLTCENGQMPDGPICPACGKERGPSGADGGSWVHLPRCEKCDEIVVTHYKSFQGVKSVTVYDKNGIIHECKKLTCENCGGDWDGIERLDPVAAFAHGIDETAELCEKCIEPIGS